MDGELEVLIKFIETSIWKILTFEPNAATILLDPSCICYALLVVFLQLVILFKESLGYPEENVIIDPF